MKSVNVKKSVKKAALPVGAALAAAAGLKPAMLKDGNGTAAAATPAAAAAAAAAHSGSTLLTALFTLLLTGRNDM